jgi:putative endonuclease
MTNNRNRVLYTGITNDIKRRVLEHKSKQIKGFTKKYNIDKLVYYEVFRDVDQALRREKQIKAGSRRKKSIWSMALIINGVICQSIYEKNVQLFSGLPGTTISVYFCRRSPRLPASRDPRDDTR